MGYLSVWLVKTGALFTLDQPYRPEGEPHENPMSSEYSVVIEKDEDGYYVGSVPALQDYRTQGPSMDQLLERMHEATTLWLAVTGVGRISGA